MEEKSLQIEKLTGQSSDSASCGVISARVSFEDGSIATLVSCILVKSTTSEEGKTAVQDIFDIASKKLEGAEAGSLDVLKQAGEASARHADTQGLEVSISHVLFYKGASYIFRAGDKVKVMAFLNGISEELSFGHGSGHLKNGQIILIATEKFLNSFDVSDTLKEKDVNLEEVVDGLATEISAKDDQSEIGAALILVKSDEVTAVADPVLAEVEEDMGEKQADQEEAELSDQLLDTSHEIAPPEPVVVDDSKIDPNQSEEDIFAVDAINKEKVSRLKVNLVSTFFGFITSKVSNINAASLKSRNTIIVLAAIILLILTGSAFMTLRGNASRESLNEFNSFLESANSKYEEGLGLIDLNREKARGLFIEADTDVKKALEIDPKDDGALELSSKISEKLRETENLATVDFSTVYEADGNLVSILKSDSLIGVTDNTVYVVDTESGSAEEIEGQTGTIDAAFYDSKIFAYDGSRVYMVDLTSGDVQEIFEGESAQDIGVFFGNVYLLGGDQIHKYTPVEGGYAQSADYLSASEQFTSTSRFVIDGSIWVTKGSEVNEYLTGEDEGFEISGLVGTVGELGEIYTESELDNVYVVDNSNSALLVISKNGAYTKSYQSPEFARASGLVVDEAGGKFYIAVGNRILSSGL